MTTIEPPGTPSALSAHPAGAPAIASLPEHFAHAQQRVLDHYGTRAVSRFVRLADPALTLHVLEAGQGDPVVFVHGGAGFAINWEPLFGDLAKSHHVYAIDRPGCGLSDGFDYRRVDLRDHVARVLTSLLDALGESRVTLVGNSHGGFWALSYTLAHPERVSRLVLVGAPAGMDRDIPLGIRVLKMPLVGRRLARLLSGRQQVPTPEGVRERMHKMIVVDAARVPQELVDVDYRGALLPAYRATARDVLAQVTTLRGWNPRYYLRPSLPRITQPTLFVWGERDAYAPPSSGQEMAAHMPNARTVPIPDAGHHPWWDHPELCTPAIEGFLRANPVEHDA